MLHRPPVQAEGVPEPIQVNLEEHPEYAPLLQQQFSFLRKRKRQVWIQQVLRGAVVVSGCLGGCLMGWWVVVQPDQPLGWLGLLGTVGLGWFSYLAFSRRPLDVQSAGVEHFQHLGLHRLLRSHLEALTLSAGHQTFVMGSCCWVGTHMQCKEGMQVSIYWLTDDLRLLCVEGQLNPERQLESFTLLQCSEETSQRVLSGHPEVHQLVFAV